MTTVALIPPRGLHGFAAYSDMHMTLATRACFTNDDYVEFYKNNKQFKILDNGANEGAVAPADVMFEYADMVGAHEIVLPDVMGNRDRTVNAVDRFLDAHSMKVLTRQCMAVVQASTMRMAMNTVKYWSQDPHITTIGIPRIYADQIGLINARIDLAREINRLLGDRFYIHFLGAVVAWPLEVKAIAKYAPFVRSIDTSMPFNFTIAGRRLETEQRVKVPRPVDYFTRDFGGLDKTLLKDNIETYKGWLAGT